MDHSSLAVSLVFPSVLAGAAGTGGMTALMHFITRRGITNADMVRAIGTVFTPSRDRAWLVGMILHLAAGVIFALLYTLIFDSLSRDGIFALTVIGAVFGATHGLVVSSFLINAVARHHPVEEFRQADFLVGAAHLLGHIVYGTLVGLILGLLRFALP